MREIEIKLRVKDLDALEKDLAVKGCVFSDPIRQEDVIYSNGREDFFESAKAGDIIVRIRRQGNIIQLNLKQQRTYEMDNTEYETEIKDAEETHKILEVLGWKPVIEVKKIRREGKLTGYKFCLDKVDDLGDFIEVEKMTNNDANPNEVRKELFKAIEPFGLTEADEETKGYDTQMYQIKSRK